MADSSIKVGLIGLGFIGKIHAHAYNAIPYSFSNPEIQADLCAILHTHTGKDQELLKSLGGPLETSDPEEFFNQDVDMVDICTPNRLHLEQVSRALEKGRHVYCEKPLGFNLEDARQMTAQAKDSGLLTHTAFCMRYYPAVQQAKAILASGVLGEIYNFRAHIFHNSYMNPQRPISWRLQKAASGGGSLADLGIHLIDMVRNLLGEATWVQCHTRTLIPSRPKTAGSTEMVPVDVDDWALCILGLQSGAQGVIEATRMSGGVTDTSSMQIFGSRGSLEIDFNHPLNVKYYDLGRNQVSIGAQDFPLPKDERPLSDIMPPAKLTMGAFIDAHFASIMDFLLCIREKRPSKLDFQAALKAQEILEAAYRSANQNGEIINLPLG